MTAKKFELADGLVGRFAIVKLWPDIKTAEDECIARLKLAANTIGVDCIEILADGSFVKQPERRLERTDVDFVIHLHYDTPKYYDAFSFVALWNPIQFYHEWGYARTSRNLTTHDDFISCKSSAADDHVAQLITRSATHFRPKFTLFHSVADVVSPPTLGDLKLFYAGINWDALRGGVSRHQELLRMLDSSGDLRIYGPTVFQGVKVWAGYKSYVRELPFDGVSMLGEISRAGVALVLSSQAHKDSELMSNRLFESIASGALVICDENPFAKRYFGDSLLYVDTRLPVQEIFVTIRRHLQWARDNSEDALELISRSQSIFRNQFSLTRSLSNLYRDFPARRLELERSREVSDALTVRIFAILPDLTDFQIDCLAANLGRQTYTKYSVTVLVDEASNQKDLARVESRLRLIGRAIDIRLTDLGRRSTNVQTNAQRRLGSLMNELLCSDVTESAIMFLAPNETLLSNHLVTLIGSLERNLGASCAAVACVPKHSSNSVHAVCDRIDFVRLDPANPMGLARFLIRTAGLPLDRAIALPYLHRKPMAVLLGKHVVQEPQATLIIDVSVPFPDGSWDEGQENNVLAGYCPHAFNVAFGHEIRVPDLSTHLPTAPRFAPTMKRMSRQWVQLQARLLLRDGLFSRIRVSVRKLSRRLSI